MCGIAALFEVIAGAERMAGPARGVRRDAAILAALVVPDTWAESDKECLIVRVLIESVDFFFFFLCTGWCRDI